MRGGGRRRITVVADRSTAERMNYSRAILWNSRARSERSGFSRGVLRDRQVPLWRLSLRTILASRTIEWCAMSQGQKQLASFGTRSNLPACARPLIVRARPKCWDIVQGHVSRTKCLKNAVNAREREAISRHVTIATRSMPSRRERSMSHDVYSRDAKPTSNRFCYRNTSISGRRMRRRIEREARFSAFIIPFAVRLVRREKKKRKRKRKRKRNYSSL